LKKILTELKYLNKGLLNGKRMPPKQARQRSARVREKRRQARNDILDAARRLLNEQGVDAVTLASVAAALGMTKPALYHYFPSKDALVSALITSLLADEIETLIAAVEAEDDPVETLPALIRAFHAHYRERLDAFRIVYSQSQLVSALEIGMDPQTLRDEVNPRTRHLFDVLEDRLAAPGASAAQRRELRRLAFTAWTSVLGLMTMLSVADATGDPLTHSDEDLLDTLVAVFTRSDAR
jgi:AcrR family transcriptional regulator